jgi:ATP-dependent RNA helicase DDX5/DBP2
LDGLPHFEKNFYNESPSVRAMTEAEVNEYRLRREITVEGKDVPKPIKSFSDASFPGTSFIVIHAFITLHFNFVSLHSI